MQKDKLKGRKKEFWWGFFCFAVRCPKRSSAKKSKKRHRPSAAPLCPRSPPLPQGPATAFPFSPDPAHPPAVRLQQAAADIASSLQSLHFPFPFPLPFLFFFCFTSKPSTHHHHPRSVCVLRQHHQGFLSPPSALCVTGLFLALGSLSETSFSTLPISPLYIPENPTKKPQP